MRCRDAYSKSGHASLKSRFTHKARPLQMFFINLLVPRFAKLPSLSFLPPILTTFVFVLALRSVIYEAESQGL